jgi:hypothetical protein
MKCKNRCNGQQGILLKNKIVHTLYSTVLVCGILLFMCSVVSFTATSTIAYRDRKHTILCSRKKNFIIVQDINDNDDDPMPQDNGDNKHGTR